MKRLCMGNRARGFSLIELMVAITVLAILVAIAVPSFTEYFAKARLRGAADDLANQFALARADAMRADRDVVVSLISVPPSTTWCSGGRQFAPVGTVGLVQGVGTASCDCSDDASVCVVAGNPSVVDSTEYRDVELVSITGTSSLQFDRKVGVLFDLAPRTFNLRSQAFPTRFQLNVVVSPLGHAKVCVPTGAASFGGYKSC